MPLFPSYKPLRKLVVDRDMKMSDLYKNDVVSRSTVSVLNMDRFVSLETLALICEYLNCRIEDVVEFVDDTQS
ncbi:helix-turn-helix domain-containing protein [Paenibacillus sp. JNUCC32]|uniref:helix-turn-helix domain-containing protein n=1 Tax=Paenibacillus sp. JNUCC32 TaxID=2777984 RepID=UPI003D2FD7EA